MNIEYVEQFLDKLDELDSKNPLPTEVHEALSHCKLQLSLYRFAGDKALEGLRDWFDKLQTALYKQFTLFNGFYTCTPFCNYVRNLYDPTYVYEEPWGYDSTYI